MKKEQKKKEYRKPRLREVKLKQSFSLLQSSEEPPTMDNGGFGFFVSNDEIYKA